MNINVNPAFRRGRVFSPMAAAAALGFCIGGLTALSPAAPSSSPACTPEPDIETALTWWPPQRNVWTPVGWKNHLFRFNVVYNGTILCAPGGWLAKPHTAKYMGDDFQLNFVPSLDGALPPIPKESAKLYKLDGGHGIQGWREDRVAPVLFTEWPSQDGVVMRQEVFAHMKGGGEVAVGTEPLYAWVRLSVSHVSPVRAPEKYTFGVQLSKNYYDVGGTLEDSVFFAVRPDKVRLPEPLTSATLAGGHGQLPGLRIEQGAGRVRMIVQPGGAGAVSLAETEGGSGVYNLKIELPAREGAHTDLLVAMMRAPAEELAEEAALGFDGALAETEDFWKVKPDTAARIRTPEKYINDALARNLQFAEIIAERNPDNGDYSFLSGSYGYDTLWSTPTSMVSHMFLDLLGYHDVVEKHVRLYKSHQGSVRPPGPGFKDHPGYFSTPKTLTSIDWLSDHGAVLEILSRHALMTGRKDFTEEWIEAVVKGCDFIKDSCASTEHEGVKGLMPPAVATDTAVPAQAVWIQAWIYKGLMTSVDLLKRLEHPRAAEFDAFAAQFKKTFNEAFLARTALEPKWTHPDGTSHPILPAHVAAPPPYHVYDDAFLLDTGPLVLPWAGLMDAGDPLMKSFADFFREGPNRKLRGPWTGAITRAVLTREIASCEPCYSWNIVNSWKTGDREKFLEGMYSLFAGAISPQTFINCEHRNAMYGNLFVAPLMTWCLRQAVVDDQLAAGELHLLRLCPLAWVSKSEETAFERMPTVYGPVDLRWRLSEDGKSLDVSYKHEWRVKPGKVLLHAPPAEGLETLTVNGVGHPATAAVDLTGAE